MQTTTNDILKETTIMALKPVYNDTRGDQKSLLRDIRPGNRIYVIHDIAERYVLGKGPHGYDEPHYYSEYEVTRDKAPFTGHPMVRCTTTGGLQSITQLHNRERRLYTQLPAGMQHIAA
ncbi:hypothetical protein ABZ135_01350 [Streptomyces sp. NPDC006339]|uniref:hypothetical protein n=1 Tax=Streptomyces sp. NPDC006339 TaxID=3156755 RepID=UPI0033AAB556